MNILAELFRRAAPIYHNEGLLSLARHGAAYVAGGLFEYKTYYMYESDGSTYSRRIDTGIVPMVDGLSFRILNTIEEADQLEAKGFQFSEDAVDARDKLNKGATAFCIFIGHELANTGWLCTTKQAMDSLNEPPASVDFSNGEVWAGGSWTNPKYRRMGLYRYGSRKMVEHWLSKGIVKNKWAVNKRNVASLNAESRAGNVRYAEGRLIKVLWWKLWKERPLCQDEP